MGAGGGIGHSSGCDGTSIGAGSALGGIRDRPDCGGRPHLGARVRRPARQRAVDGRLLPAAGAGGERRVRGRSGPGHRTGLGRWPFNWFFLPPLHTFTDRRLAELGLARRLRRHRPHHEPARRRLPAPAGRRPRRAGGTPTCSRSSPAPRWPTSAPSGPGDRRRRRRRPGARGRSGAGSSSIPRTPGRGRHGVDSSASGSGLRDPAGRPPAAARAARRSARRSRSRSLAGHGPASPPRSAAWPPWPSSAAASSRQALEAESLRRSDELKTALLRSVSHELRTPLTAVRTAGEALAHEPPATRRGGAHRGDRRRDRAPRAARATTSSTSRAWRRTRSSPASTGAIPTELAAGAVEAASAAPRRGSGRRDGGRRPAPRARRCRPLRAGAREPSPQRGPARRRRPSSSRSGTSGGHMEFAVADRRPGPRPERSPPALFSPFVSGARRGHRHRARPGPRAGRGAGRDAAPRPGANGRPLRALAPAQPRCRRCSRDERPRPRRGGRAADPARPPRPAPARPEYEVEPAPAPTAEALDVRARFGRPDAVAPRPSTARRERSRGVPGAPGVEPGARSWWSRPSATRPRRSRRWTPGRTTTSPSPTRPRSSWRVCARSCDARRHPSASRRA